MSKGWGGRLGNNDARRALAYDELTDIITKRPQQQKGNFDVRPLQRSRGRIKSRSRICTYLDNLNGHLDAPPTAVRG
jgi:hypothetical protein